MTEALVLTAELWGSGSGYCRLGAVPAELTEAHCPGHSVAIRLQP